MFAPALMSDNAALRTVLNAALLLGTVWVFLSVGMGVGERDLSSDALRAKNPRQEPYPSDYNRTRTALAAVIAALPWLLLGATVAVLAQPYTYTLQDLPGWLGPYMRQNDVGRALEYYDRQRAIAIVDWLRMGQRFAILPYVYLFASSGDAASFRLDRLSWLPPVIMPAAYYIGYLFGPSRRARTVRMIEEAKSKPRMRLKKNVKNRTKRPDPERNRLI